MKGVLWLVGLSIAAIALLWAAGYDVTVGGLVWNAEDVEKRKASGSRRSRIVIGGCVIGRDVQAQSLVEAVPSLTIVGGCVVDKSVASAYGDRLKVIGGLSLRSNEAEAP